MRAETAEERRCAAEWAAMDLKSGMGWELEVEVESGTAGGEQAAEAGAEGGGGATVGRTKVERM